MSLSRKGKEMFTVSSIWRNGLKLTDHSNAVWILFVLCITLWPLATACSCSIMFALLCICLFCFCNFVAIALGGEKTGRIASRLAIRSGCGQSCLFAHPSVTYVQGFLCFWQFSNFMKFWYDWQCIYTGHAILTFLYSFMYYRTDILNHFIDCLPVRWKTLNKMNIKYSNTSNLINSFSRRHYGTINKKATYTAASFIRQSIFVSWDRWSCNWMLERESWGKTYVCRDKKEASRYKTVTFFKTFFILHKQT